MCGGVVCSILLLPLGAKCPETIDVCLVFMSIVVTVWFFSIYLWGCLLCIGRC